MESVFYIITGAFLVLSLLNLIGLGFLVSYVFRLAEAMKTSSEEIKKSNADLIEEMKQSNAPLVEFLVKLADEVKKQNRTLKTIEQIMEDINEEEEVEAEMKAQQARIKTQRRARGLPEEPGLVDVDQGVSYDERYRPPQE